MKKISRKTFLKSIIAISVAVLGYLTFKSTEYPKIKSIKSSEIKCKIAEIPYGIKIIDQYIISKSEEEIIIFSSKCPHLGCYIDQYIGDELICPCHGSRFNNKGEVVSGPAIANLKRIEFNISNGIISLKDDYGF